MTTTTRQTPMHADMSKVLALLAVGHTIHRVSDLADWPLTSIRALINGQRGWILGANDRVTCPGSRTGVTVPDGVHPGDLEWARGQLTAPAASSPPAPPVGRSPVPESPEPDAPPTSPPATAQVSTPPPRTMSVAMVPLDKIHPHPYNVRVELGDLTEFAASIRAQGLLQPLTVRPHPTIADDFEAIAGHRRHEACRLAGLAAVPCVIRTDIDDTTAVELMIIENLQRRALNPIEKAEAFGRLRDQHALTATQIADRTGLSQSTISYFLSLLELDTRTRERVRRGELAVGDAIKRVRKQRAKARNSDGSGTRDWTWEPDHFARTHALAKKANALCEAREHTTRRQLGGIACGQCWETVVRGDERIVVATQQESPSE